MTPSKHARATADAGLDMDLALAVRACMAQLPALAARRLGAHAGDIEALMALAERSESAQRLGRKLFGLMANASVHCGGANTLRPLFDQCSLVRTYLWLHGRVAVTAPEPLVRGTPDLLVEAGGEAIWIDTRARPPEVMAERGRQAVLLVDRTVSMRRQPPLRLGAGYAGEFHLLDTRKPGKGATGMLALEQQPCAWGEAPAPASVRALAAATGAHASRRTATGSGLGISA